MTLIATVNGRESIWLLANRRLSYMNRPPKDNARKVMFLEATDGVAIVGYAGLGATALGTVPADWMSAVLRGRKLPLEQSLRILADAMKRQLPQHMLRIWGREGPAHNVLVTAHVGEEVRLYSIDLVFSPDRKRYHFRHTRHVMNEATMRTPRIGLAGSGATYLLRDGHWIRPLLRLMKAYDRGQVSPRGVTDHLAKLNNYVHLGMKNSSVGPHCIIAWRNRKMGIHKGGGGHYFYSGVTRDRSTPSIPAIAVGFDVHAIVNVMMPHWQKTIKSIRGGKQLDEMNDDELNTEMARLPHKPDENLR